MTWGSLDSNQRPTDYELIGFQTEIEPSGGMNVKRACVYVTAIGESVLHAGRYEDECARRCIDILTVNPKRELSF